MTLSVKYVAPDRNASAKADRGYARRRAQQALAEATVPADTDCPINHAHLSRYTLADRDLEAEILGLFAGQVPATMARLRAVIESDPSPLAAKEWQAASHTLKGSARAVGAFRVAEAAENAESTSIMERDKLARLLEALDELVAEVSTYIGRLSRGADGSTA